MSSEIHTHQRLALRKIISIPFFKYEEITYYNDMDEIKCIKNRRNCGEQV